MRNLLLAATALFPLTLALGAGQGAHAATYTVVAPGKTPAAGQFASLDALAAAQKNAAFIQPGDVIMLPDGALAPDDQAQFYNIGTPANPVTFQSAGYTIIPNLTGARNGKGTLTFYSSDIVIQGLIFMGSSTGDAENEAGIRMDVNNGYVDANGQPYPYNLTVRNSAFVMKADGILADDCSILQAGSQYSPPGTKAPNAPCTVTLDRTYFTGNGNTGGQDHAIYIDHVDQLTVTNSLFLGGLDGHLIKSRGYRTDIENNRLIEGPFAGTNSLIDMPVGGNLTVKNNVLEAGPHNYNGFINYNEEAYPPYLNGQFATILISGNTFIDDWSGGNSYTSVVLWDDSLDTSKTAPLTHIPAGVVESLTVTGNHFYGPKWTAANMIRTGNTNGNGYGAAPTFFTVDGTNTIAASGAPALDTTPPVAWPTNTTTETLNVPANGFFLPKGDGTYTYPNAVLWWNGLPLLPAPVSVTADQTTGAQQTITYQVPVIPLSPEYMNMQLQNPVCCEFEGSGSLSVQSGSPTVTVAFPNYRQPTGASVVIGWGNTTVGGMTIPAGSRYPITVVDANTFTFQGPSPATSAGTVSTQVSFSAGIVLNLLPASTLGGVAPVQPEPGPVLGAPDVIFPASSVTPPPPPPPPPVDTTPPVLAKPIALTLVAGTSAPLVLSATDRDNTAAQLSYRVTTAPAHGTVEDGGEAASSFTQADIAAGRVTYVETGSAATTDVIGFTVSDPAGNSVSGTLPITVTAPARRKPRVFKLAPGVMLIPHSDGSWRWK